MLTAAFFISSVMFYSIIFKVLIKSVNSVFKFLLSFIRRIFLLCKIDDHGKNTLGGGRNFHVFPF